MITFKLYRNNDKDILIVHLLKFFLRNGIEIQKTEYFIIDEINLIKNFPTQF